MRKTIKKMSTILIAVLLVIAVLTPSISAVGPSFNSGSCNTIWKMVTQNTGLSQFLSTICAQCNSALCNLFGLNCIQNTCPASTCPTIPAAPTTPTAPAAPTTPAGPTAPTAPTAPAKPTAPTTPAPPAKPVTPTAPTPPAKPTTPTAPTNTIGSFEQQVVDLVNEARKQNGLNPLTLNTKLSDIARMKSQDMLDKGYFDHNSPTYGTPFQMMTNNGISYRAAGENIAMGYTTPQAVMTAWMNSSGHRANILNASYTQIGVGYVANGNYWTQEFIG